MGTLCRTQFVLPYASILKGWAMQSVIEKGLSNQPRGSIDTLIQMAKFRKYGWACSYTYAILYCRSLQQYVLKLHSSLRSDMGSMAKPQQPTRCSLRATSEPRRNV